MINVIQMLDSLERGGAEMMCLEVCRNARRYGLNVTLVTASGGALEDSFRRSGVDIVKFPRRYPVDPQVVSSLRKLIRQKQISIAHAYQPVDALHLYLAKTRMPGSKLVLSHQGFLETWKNIRAARFLSGRVDANVVCGRGFFEGLREEIDVPTDDRFYLIPNAIDISRFENPVPALREELGVGKKAFLMGSVANIRPLKDQLTICRALGPVFEKYPSAKFVFVGRVVEGEEDYFEECIDLCDENGYGENVLFLGARDDVPDILSSLDLFVQASEREGLPISVIEAMLAGVPMVLSSIEPHIEASNGGRCAEIFQTRNAEDLTEKMLFLLGNKRLRTKRSKDAKKHAASVYSIDSHMMSLSLLYRQLLEAEGDSASVAAA